MGAQEQGGSATPGRRRRLFAAATLALLTAAAIAFQVLRSARSAEPTRQPEGLELVPTAPAGPPAAAPGQAEPARGGCRLTGALLDQDERALAGVELELRECPAAGERAVWRAELVAAEGCGPAAGRARDDGLGFAFDGLAPGGWALFARGRRDLPRAAYLFRITPDQRARHLRLVLPRGLGLQGRVSGPEGEPSALVSVRIEGLDGAFAAEERTAPDGGFAFGPLLPGRYRVAVSGAEHLTAPERVVVAGEGEFLELRQASSGSLCLSVRDETGAAVAARVELRGVTSRSEIGSELRFARLEPGAYELVARASDGRLGILQGLWVAGGLVAEPLEVVVRRGAPLRLALSGREGCAWRASWRGTLVEQGELLPGMAVTLHLPPGPVQVAWFDVRAGETLELARYDERVLAPDAEPLSIEYEQRP